MEKPKSLRVSKIGICTLVLSQEMSSPHSFKAKISFKPEQKSYFGLTTIGLLGPWLSFNHFFSMDVGSLSNLWLSLSRTMGNL